MFACGSCCLTGPCLRVLGSNGIPVSAVSSGTSHVLHLVFHATVGHRGPCNSMTARRRCTTTHRVNGRNVILLGGTPIVGGNTPLLPVSTTGCRGVLIINSGTMHLLGRKKNSSRLGIGSVMSPLSNLHTICNSGMTCTGNCTTNHPVCNHTSRVPRGIMSSLHTRTIRVTGGTSLIMLMNKLGGGRFRSYRNNSHLRCNLPFKRSRLVRTLLKMGGGLILILLDNGTIRVP